MSLKSHCLFAETIGKATHCEDGQDLTGNFCTAC